MNNWTDGTDPLAPIDNLWMTCNEFQGVHHFANSCPIISRKSLIKRVFGKENYLIKLTNPGDDFAYAKLHCDDFGYYRVQPTYELHIDEPKSVN